MFDFPLEAIGTKFQERVWSEVKKIPYGETKTYKEIATLIGNENSSRAVGNANNKNPLLIVIPCHRVTRSDSKTGGYSLGTSIKAKLLNLENKSN